MCVLLIEDESIIQWTSSDALEDAGHDVMTADTADDALDLINDHPGMFSAVVADLRVATPLTAPELVARVRQTIPSIPIVIASEAAAAVSQEWCGQHHVALLPKPYDPDALASLIDRLLTI